MSAKVIPFNGITRLELTVDLVLEQAKSHLDGVIIIGYEEDGELYFATSFADGGQVLWLLEKCKEALMSSSGVS